MAIAFVTVKGPVATDLADGVKAFNDIATVTDSNFRLLNDWASDVKSVGYALGPTYYGAAVATPASGYKLYKDHTVDETYSRMWGACVYVQVRLQRTGADIAVGGDGNITDHTVATLASAYRPTLSTQITAPANASAGPCVITVLTTGEMSIHAVNQDGDTIKNGDVIEVSFCFVAG